MTTSRKWVMTLFNFSDYEHLPKIVFHESLYKYIILGKEVCPTTGKEHIQGYVHFKHRAYSMTSLSAIFGDQGHFEIAKGDDVQNKFYCNKDNNVVYEYGDAVGSKQGARTDLKVLKDKILSGDRISECLDMISNHQQLKFAESLLKYQKPKQKFKAKKVVWVYGPTGSGKTRYCMDHTDDDYWISGTNLRWFDGYTGQKTVIFDEFRKDYCTFHMLLRLLDGYPIRVETKGASVLFEPEVIYITSCFHPKDVYETREDIEQLLRRITKIKRVS